MIVPDLIRLNNFFCKLSKMKIKLVAPSVIDSSKCACILAVPLEPKSGCDYVGSWGEWSECKGSSRLSDYVPETKVMTDELKAEGKGMHTLMNATCSPISYISLYIWKINLHICFF